PPVEAWIERLNDTDIPEGVLGYLDSSIDDLAVVYPAGSPSVVLRWAQSGLRLARAMLDRRMTLAEHRRLSHLLAWYSLLAAACHIDLGHHLAARRRIRVARDIALEAEHDELTAWAMQTTAWQELTGGAWAVAATACQVARHVAPRDSDVSLQATAQEARALARTGDRAGAYAALRTVARLIDDIGAACAVEHHFLFDVTKSDSYTATALTWLGDPAAVSFARQVIGGLEASPYPRPRRLATARIDLGLALLATGGAGEAVEEATSAALAAATSGHLVPATLWRLEELVDELERVDVTAARRVREAYRASCPQLPQFHNRGASRPT